jgi:hypothetical protein
MSLDISRAEIELVIYCIKGKIIYLEREKKYIEANKHKVTLRKIVRILESEK